MAKDAKLIGCVANTIVAPPADPMTLCMVAASGPFAPQDRHAVHLYAVQGAFDPTRVLIAHARNDRGCRLAVYERDFTASPRVYLCARSDDRDEGQLLRGREGSIPRSWNTASHRTLTGRKIGMEG